MVYMVTQLVSDAFNTSGIVGKEFEQVSGEQQDEGFQFLNSMLARKTADKSAIPYFLRYSSSFVIGQEQYVIPGLIDVSSMTFFIDSPAAVPITPPNMATFPTPIVAPQTNEVRYAMRKVDRKLYWGAPRANQIQSLPYQFYVERQFGGSTIVGAPSPTNPYPLGGASIFVYFLPSTAWTFEIWGLFALTAVTRQQDLSRTLDQFYLDFLKFELAEYICAEYDYSMPEGAAKQLERYQMIIDKREQRMDLVEQSISPLTNVIDGLNYAYVNLGTGWSPGS